MYLAEIINKVLDSKKSQLTGDVQYTKITKTLNYAFRRCEPFKFRVELYDDYEIGDFSVSGLFDLDTEKRYVILNFSNRTNSIMIDERKWQELRFAISQTCQHESLHKLQFQHRVDNDSYDGKLEFRRTSASKDEEREYLSERDEIDAYAHDIAMEIKYFYPKKDPYKVLQKLNRHKNIWSYKYYRITFRGTNWSAVRNRLLKKTYMWLPHVTI